MEGWGDFSLLGFAELILAMDGLGERERERRNPRIRKAGGERVGHRYS